MLSVEKKYSNKSLKSKVFICNKTKVTLSVYLQYIDDSESVVYGFKGDFKSGDKNNYIELDDEDEGKNIVIFRTCKLPIFGFNEVKRITYPIKEQVFLKFNGLSKYGKTEPIVIDSNDVKAQSQCLNLIQHTSALTTNSPTIKTFMKLCSAKYSSPSAKKKKINDFLKNTDRYSKVTYSLFFAQKLAFEAISSIWDGNYKIYDPSSIANSTKKYGPYDSIGSLNVKNGKASLVSNKESVNLMTNNKVKMENMFSNETCNFVPSWTIAHKFFTYNGKPAPLGEFTAVFSGIFKDEQVVCLPENLTFKFTEDTRSFYEKLSDFEKLLAAGGLFIGGPILLKYLGKLLKLSKTGVEKLIEYGDNKGRLKQEWRESVNYKKYREIDEFNNSMDRLLTNQNEIKVELNNQLIDSMKDDLIALGETGEVPFSQLRRVRKKLLEVTEEVNREGDLNDVKIRNLFKEVNDSIRVANEDMLSRDEGIAERTRRQANQIENEIKNAEEAVKNEKRKIEENEDSGVDAKTEEVADGVVL